MPLLEGHIAVVTGAASGIGRAIAKGFAQEGARVALLDIDAKAAADVAGEIRGAGGQAESFALDVTRREDCFAVAKEIAAKVGRVSILVNNAGINRRNAFTAEPDAVLKDWQDIMAINLNGVFNVTHAFLDALRASKGRIVNIASIQSFVRVRRAHMHKGLDRGDVDDAALAGPQRIEEGVGDVEDAVEVDRHDILPVLQDGIGIGGETVAAVDAGIV